MKIIKSFVDGSNLSFNRGRFDNWCVYLNYPNNKNYAPKDIDSFRELISFGNVYGNRNIYADFVEIYENTNNEPNEIILDRITEIADTYNENSLQVDKIFTILYMCMIAEENKEKSKLGKKIKRLGIHQILIEECTAEYAANFSRGRKWRELDEYCSERGF